MSEKRPGRPRQRAEGSRRRDPQDADTEVGESPCHCANSGAFVLSASVGIRSGASADLMSEKRPGWPRQRAQGSRRRSPQDADAQVGESPCHCANGGAFVLSDSSWLKKSIQDFSTTVGKNAISPNLAKSMILVAHP